MTFGEHLILDCTGMNDNMSNKEEIQKFIDELVNNVLKMKKKGDTVFEYFEDNEYNRERDIVGYSVVQVISLSSIVLHLNDISRTGYIDIFTCGDLKLDDIASCINRYFSPDTMKKLMILRDGNYGPAILPFENE
jgi:S-adenosylmethionine/arginine decarboxylase-like enzyme